MNEASPDREEKLEQTIFVLKVIFLGVTMSFLAFSLIRCSQKDILKTDYQLLEEFKELKELEDSKNSESLEELLESL